MPEFQLNIGAAYPTWVTLDDFTKGYLEAAFFADCPEDESWENASLADISPDAWEGILGDCSRFKSLACPLLIQALSTHDYKGAQAGRDLWFTRQGHGTGFWDRGLGEVGDKLAALCGWKTEFPGVDFEGWFL